MGTVEVSKLEKVESADELHNAMMATLAEGGIPFAVQTNEAGDRVDMDVEQFMEQFQAAMELAMDHAYQSGWLDCAEKVKRTMPDFLRSVPKEYIDHLRNDGADERPVEDVRSMHGYL